MPVRDSGFYTCCGLLQGRIRIWCVSEIKFPRSLLIGPNLATWIFVSNEIRSPVERRTCVGFCALQRLRAGKRGRLYAHDFPNFGCATLRLRRFPPVKNACAIAHAHFQFWNYALGTAFLQCHPAYEHDDIGSGVRVRGRARAPLFLCHSQSQRAPRHVTDLQL